MVACLAAPSPAAATAGSAPPDDAPALLDPASLADAREGLDHLYHARTKEAAVVFERIRARHPDSPAADFLLGGIAWQDLVTGPQGFAGAGPAQDRFFARMDAAIAAGEKAVAANPGDISARFFLGGAYGYEARYLALQERWWDAYRTGRKGLKHLERVANDAPSVGDVYLGLGIYHYYADVVPAVLKVLAGIVGLGGDRERGLEEIRRALRDGQLVQAEAAFFLAEISTDFEENHWTALGYSRALRDRYPENELFTWLNARVLDELHLTEQAAAEWRTLRKEPRTARVRGFLDYRLARTRLGSGDFEGAAKELGDLLERGRLGSRRITMWGRLRYGLALDFLGRHEEAMKQYRLAKDLDASDSAEKRATARLEAGQRDPAVVSLEEIQEAAAIVRDSPRHGEESFRRLEAQVTGPSRGLAPSDARRYFRILVDLAAARLVRGDAAGAEAAVDRALDAPVRPPRESRVDLLALRARARVRLGRLDEADEDLRQARSLAAGRAREARDAERVFVAVLREGRPPSSLGQGAASVRFEAPDRGELSLEVQGDFLPHGQHLHLELQKGKWVGEARFAVPTTVLYRFVVDGTVTRPDPRATRILLRGDEAWCEQAPESKKVSPLPPPDTPAGPATIPAPEDTRPTTTPPGPPDQPKQTNPSPSE